MLAQVVITEVAHPWQRGSLQSESQSASSMSRAGQRAGLLCKLPREDGGRALVTVDDGRDIILVGGHDFGVGVEAGVSITSELADVCDWANN